MSEMNDPTHAGGSAPPDARGPGSGAADAGSQLTGAMQTAANDTLDGLQQLANHIFDAGEGALEDALKVVDAAQTGVSNALTALTAKITGGEVGDLPTVPTADVATGLTDTAQQAANRAINGLQQFANHAFDIGEEGLEDALRVVDAAQSQVSSMFSSLTGVLAGKLGQKKG
jgi:hypothetical protein